MFIIVLYEENFFECASYKTFLSNYLNFPIFIYDNSFEPRHSQKEFNLNITYLHNPLNPGLSYAYNHAALYAKNKKIDWILLLDQDTKFPPNTLNRYLLACKENPDIFLFVPKIKMSDMHYMSPTKTFYHFTRPLNKVPSGRLKLRNFTAINSGMLVNIEAFFKCGGYNSKVKLDYSDYEFINRFKKEYKYFYVIDEECYQSFSNEVQNREQKINRFKLFCNSLKNCEKENFLDKLLYGTIILKRTLSLFISTHSFKPFKIMFTEYF